MGGDRPPSPRLLRLCLYLYIGLLFRVELYNAYVKVVTPQNVLRRHYSKT